MRREIDVVMLADNKNKGENTGIDQLERALSKGIAERMEPFHYDEVCRGDGASIVRAIRTSDDQIDVLSTFMKIRNIRKGNGGGK